MRPNKNLAIATIVQTITTPDRIYFNHLRSFWFFFLQISSSGGLTKIGNFIKNDANIYQVYRPLSILAVMWVICLSASYLSYRLHISGPCCDAVFFLTTCLTTYRYSYTIYTIPYSMKCKVIHHVIVIKIAKRYMLFISVPAKSICIN